MATEQTPAKTAAPAENGGKGSKAAGDAQLDRGRYDYGARRKSNRSGREKGCWVYIPADELRRAGIDPEAPAPSYKMWGDKRGSVLVRLYKER